MREVCVPSDSPRIVHICANQHSYVSTVFFPGPVRWDQKPQMYHSLLVPRKIFATQSSAHGTGDTSHVSKYWSNQTSRLRRHVSIRVNLILLFLEQKKMRAPVYNAFVIPLLNICHVANRFHASLNSPWHAFPLSLSLMLYNPWATDVFAW